MHTPLQRCDIVTKGCMWSVWTFLKIIFFCKKNWAISFGHTFYGNILIILGNDCVFAFVHKKKNPQTFSNKSVPISLMAMHPIIFVYIFCSICMLHSYVLLFLFFKYWTNQSRKKLMVNHKKCVCLCICVVKCKIPS